MIERIDNRGKRFTIDDDDVVDERIDRAVGQSPSSDRPSESAANSIMRKRLLVQPAQIRISRCSTDNARRA